MQTPITHSEKLILRLTPEHKQMLQDAAAAVQLSVSDFVLESALARAEEILADRRYFDLNAEQWEAFLMALDAPPRELPRIKRPFSEPGVFENNSLI